MPRLEWMIVGDAAGERGEIVTGLIGPGVRLP